MLPIKPTESLDLNKPFTADNMITLLLKARHCEKACLEQHGEVLTDIVADFCIWGRVCCPNSETIIGG